MGDSSGNWIVGDISSDEARSFLAEIGLVISTNNIVEYYLDEIFHQMMLIHYWDVSHSVLDGLVNVSAKKRVLEKMSKHMLSDTLHKRLIIFLNLYTKLQNERNFIAHGIMRRPFFGNGNKVEKLILSRPGPERSRAISMTDIRCVSDRFVEMASEAAKLESDIMLYMKTKGHEHVKRVPKLRVSK